jgi:hypothetical protein
LGYEGTVGILLAVMRAGIIELRERARSPIVSRASLATFLIFARARESRDPARGCLIATPGT